MDSPPSTARASRVCDRCTNLKTQCSREDPCSRCVRLRVECTRNRPLRSRGRPRRNASGRTVASPVSRSRLSTRDSSDPPLPPTQASHAPLALCPALPDVIEVDDWTGFSSEFLAALSLAEGLPNLPIDAVSAARLLHQILSQSRHLGFYGILPQNCHVAHLQQFDPVGETAEPIGHELSYSLLATSLELFPGDRLFNEHNDRVMAKDTLRMSALALTPNLSWKNRRLKLHNSLCLLFLGYTYCFTTEFVDIALRWNSLAWVIFLDHVRCLDRGRVVHELESRTADGLLFQDRVLSLLHHGRASGINTADCKPFTSSISDELWHGIVPRYSVASQELATPQSRQPSYFQLFHPFIKVLDCVIENPVKHTESWRMAIEKAENVYFDFPPDLLLLDAIEFAYQAETMIWLHGAFIVLYGHLDILSLLFEPQFLHKEQFAKILDHSFLLSEVLPHLLRLNPPLTFLSPATVLFILLSSAVQSLALRQYFPFQSHSSHDGLTVPQRLFESSRLHLRALSTLSTQAGRWQHELIAEVHRLLSYCTSRVLHQADSQEPPFSAVNLMRYRWCGSGSGVLPLSPAAARQEWHFSSLPESELWSGPTGDEEALRNVVAELCNPSARMCRSGYLDLSHFYAHDTSLHRDGSLLSRLTLNGQDNQAIRFLVNRFQRSFVAIGESGCPLLDEILPLAGSYPSILSALLALAARLRAPHTGAERFGPGGAATADYLTPSDTGSPASNALSWHQATISGIRSKLLRIQTEHTEEGDLKEILAASLLLTIFGFPQQINNWSMHVQGMIALIESTDPAMVESLPIARLVRAFAAHNDIYAFSLGRPEESHRAWLNWDIWPRESSGARTTNLTLFEITIGYPESMITLIAIMSGAFDDTAKYGRLSTSLHARLKHTFDSALATTRLPLLRDLHSLAAPACGGLSWPTMMEVILESWTPPPIPQHISFKLSVAILIAWECIRKAALIYLWRGGFDANATTPLDPIRGPTAQSYLRQLLHNINGLLSLAETNRITIANAMLWTLVVVGNECCRETGLRAELLRVLTRAHEYFSITHFGHGIRLLEELWARVDDALVDREDGQGQGQGWLQRPLHLQALAKELDLCVPLF